MSDSPEICNVRHATHVQHTVIQYDCGLAHGFLPWSCCALIHRIKELSAELTIKTQQLVHLQEARGSRGLKHTEHVMGDLHQTVEGLSREVAAKNAEIKTLQVCAAQLPSSLHHVLISLKAPFALVCPMRCTSYALNHRP